MAETSLRSLAKAYAKKNIEHDAYRDARAKFIEGVLSGEMELPVNEYPSLIKPAEDESQEVTVRRGDKKKSTLIEPIQEEIPPTPPQKNRTILLACVVALIVILAVLGILFTGGESDEASTSSVVVTEQAVSQNDSNEARGLVREFLQQRNWSASNLDSFLERWNALPAGSRTSAMDSIEINQLATAVYKQLLEERALSGIGDAEKAINKQKQLIDFAERIGINDSRLTMLE